MSSGPVYSNDSASKLLDLICTYLAHADKCDPKKSKPLDHIAFHVHCCAMCRGCVVCRQVHWPATACQQRFKHVLYTTMAVNFTKVCATYTAKHAFTHSCANGKVVMCNHC